MVVTRVWRAACGSIRVMGPGDLSGRPAADPSTAVVEEDAARIVRPRHRPLRHHDAAEAVPRPAVGARRDSARVPGEWAARHGHTRAGRAFDQPRRAETGAGVSSLLSHRICWGEAYSCVLRRARDRHGRVALRHRRLAGSAARLAANPPERGEPERSAAFHKMAPSESDPSWARQPCVTSPAWPGTALSGVPTPTSIPAIRAAEQVRPPTARRVRFAGGPVCSGRVNRQSGIRVNRNSQRRLGQEIDDLVSELVCQGAVLVAVFRLVGLEHFEIP